ncbi:hypothetical protein JCM11251_001181 [Rhodosporidiobolus azoricus]
MASTLAPSSLSPSPVSGSILPSPAALADSRPASSSSSRFIQAQQASSSAERGGGSLYSWARVQEGEGGREQTRRGYDLERQQEGGRSGAQGGEPSHARFPSAISAGSPGSFNNDSLTSPASSSNYRTSSAGDSSSFSFPSQTLSSPLSSQQYSSYPSSSLSSTTATEAIFDYDNLLGPRPSARATSNTSASPPSSTEEEKPRPPPVGLGFSAGSGIKGGAEASAGGEWYEEGEDDSWLHIQSSTARAGFGGDADLLPTPPTSSPPSLPGSLSGSGGGGGHVRQLTSTSGVGSPLSPLVAPFSPAGLATAGRVSGGSPWASTVKIGGGGGGGFGQASERETSWNNPLSTMSSPTLGPYPPISSRGARSREPTFSNLTSGTTSFASTPSQSRLGGGEAFSPQAYQAGQFGVSPAVALEQHHQGLEISSLSPPTSQPMSQTGSRDSSSVLSRRKPTSAIPSTVSAVPLSLASLSLTAATHSTAGSVSGAESVHSGGHEEISTIFVVGFPEDMTEREFHNLFTFAEGFEAATLKIPLRESTPAPAGDSAAIHGGSSEAGGDGVEREQPLAAASAIPPHFSAAAAVAAVRETAGSPLGGSSNGASTPLSASGGNGGATPRKQIIGFARFKTRQQAVEAKDWLTGRKIEVSSSSSVVGAGGGEKGAGQGGPTMKAEMAKKNLHTKKSTGANGATSAAAEQTTPAPALAPPTVPLPLAAASSTPAVSQPSNAAPNGSMPPGTGPSIPLSALDSNTLSKIANVSHMNPAVLAEIARQSMAAAMANKSAPAPETLDSKSAFDAFHSVPPSGPFARPLQSTRDAMTYDEQQQQYRNGSIAEGPGPISLGGGGGGLAPLSPDMSDSSISPPSGGPLGPYAAARGLLPHQQQQQLYPTEELVRGVPPQGGFVDPVSFVGAGGARERQTSFPTIAGGGGAYGGSPLPPHQLGPTPRQQAMGVNPLIASPPLGYAQVQVAAGLGPIPRTQNPADMNAPKNTLYVGGLPAVLPSLTGPFSASHLEDSLRNAFSRCPGFKRLQFRSKSNGPIVFVEFVDTAHATKAMQELYGHTLGGLVKGGIRLSYSKNPLGVRSNGLPSGNPPVHGGPDPLGGPPLHGSFVPSQAYPASPPLGVPTPYDALPYDPHRRPPDPIYGETAFPPTAGIGSTSHTPQLASLARSPPLSSPGFGGLTPSGGFGSAGPGSSSTSTPSQYGGAFSPFGHDG